MLGRNGRKTNLLFSILKESKDNSENPVQFTSNFYQIICNSSTYKIMNQLRFTNFTYIYMLIYIYLSWIHNCNVFLNWLTSSNDYNRIYI